MTYAAYKCDLQRMTSVTARLFYQGLLGMRTTILRNFLSH